MVDCCICIDTGNSGTKIVYSLSQTDKTNSLFMSSAIDEVSSERMENQLKHSNWIGFSQPEQQAWIRDGNSVIAVGQMAEKFCPTDRRSVPKYENALYKIMAAIGVIVERHFDSKKRKIKIQLGLLLPWDEYKDRKRLWGELQRLTPEYEFRSRKIRVKIEDFLCYPEGGGIAVSRIAEKGLDWFKQQRLGILMLGDRNWTGLCFESGQIKRGASPLMGFSFLLDRVIKTAPCLLNRDKLNNAIFKGITEASKGEYYSPKPLWGELEAIRSLATARNSNLRKSEIEDLDKAITLGEREWEEKLKLFLKEIFPNRLTELNVCGGPLPFFKPFIEAYFNCAVGEKMDCSPIDLARPYTPVLAHGGIANDVAEALEFKSIAATESAFSVRFADVFSLFEYLKAE